MNIEFSSTQISRLNELGATKFDTESVFQNIAERNEKFLLLESSLVKKNRNQLEHIMDTERIPFIHDVEQLLSDWLIKRENFIRVSTPIIISSKSLEKMSITKEHPLYEQVFHLDSRHCLRPMLASNLYETMESLRKSTNRIIRIFESGPCFRKETNGSRHLGEFTMLNFVELAGVQDGYQVERLKQLAISAMHVLDIQNYEITVSKSEVYGETLDIISGDLELASGAYGPHHLDGNWGIFDPWIGIGFGIERIVMIKKGYNNIKKAGRSVKYFYGISLKI